MSKKPRQKTYICGDQNDTMKTNQVNEPMVAYNTLENNNVLWLIEQVRNGVNYNKFLQFVSNGPFNLIEWAGFLHLSERTMLRYKQEEKTFDTLQSEKIIEIAILQKKGAEIFGNTSQFNLWLGTPNLALGKAKPKEMLDNSFGINLLKDELTRIEFGVLA
jgi:putative toxin-antitoxin system antitoxin component (TIGR02293 family)